MPQPCNNRNRKGARTTNWENFPFSLSVSPTSHLFSAPLCVILTSPGQDFSLTPVFFFFTHSGWRPCEPIPGVKQKNTYQKCPSNLQKVIPWSCIVCVMVDDRNPLNHRGNGVTDLNHHPIYPFFEPFPLSLFLSFRRVNVSHTNTAPPSVPQHRQQGRERGVRTIRMLWSLIRVPHSPLSP